MKNKPKAATVYSGAGGADIGLKMAGFDTMFGIENHPHAQACFRENFPKVPLITLDVRKVTPSYITEKTGVRPGDLDLLHLSNPCTGVSATGEQEMWNWVNELFFHSQWQVYHLSPKVFIIENVPNVSGKGMEILYAMVMAVAEKMPYKIKCVVQSSLGFGVPQHRKRWFMMGVHNDLNKLPSFPEPDLSRITTIGDVLPYIDHITNINFGNRAYTADQPICTITSSAIMTKFSNGETSVLTSEERGILCSVPKGYNYLKPETEMNARIGNMVMPLHMKAIAEWVKHEILDYPRPT